MVGRLIPVELLGVTVSLCVQADAEARGDPGRAAGRGCGAAAGAHRVRGQRRRAPGGALPGGEDSHGCPAEGTCLVLAVPSAVCTPVPSLLNKHIRNSGRSSVRWSCVTSAELQFPPGRAHSQSVFALCWKEFWRAGFVGSPCVEGCPGDCGGSSLCCRRGEAQEGQGMWAVLQEELTGAFSSWQSEGQRCRNPSPPSSWEVL